MTILLHDTKEDIENMQGVVNSLFIVQDLVYAHDTLLIGVDGDRVQGYMENVALIRADYGLQLNWNKVEALPCRMNVQLQSPTGENIQSKQSMVYLSSLLSSDGKIMSETSRRLGMARKDFEVLQSIWKHTTLIKFWKLRIFDAGIVSKLLYGLVTAVLNKASEKKKNPYEQSSALCRARSESTTGWIVHQTVQRNGHFQITYVIKAQTFITNYRTVNTKPNSIKNTHTEK